MWLSIIAHIIKANQKHFASTKFLKNLKCSVDFANYVVRQWFARQLRVPVSHVHVQHNN
jgi:hypothetical protein